MPETDVIFKFEAQDDLSPVLDKIKAELDDIAKSSQQAQSAISKSVTGGGSPGAPRESHAQAIEHENFLMEQMKELSAGIGYNIGLWNIGFMASQMILDGIKDTFTEIGTAQQNFVQIQNVTGESIGETKERFDELKQIAHETGLDLEKNVEPAFRKLIEAGFGFGEAEEMTNRLMRTLKETGIDLTDVAVKADEGSASFKDMMLAGNALGDAALTQWASAWSKAQAAEATYDREMERNHELTTRAMQDQQRLTDAHEEFASTAGISKGVFSAFQQAQGPGGGLARGAFVPSALADLPGARQALGRLIGELQGQLKTGMGQLAKELGMPLQTIEFGVKAGLPGFDQQSLMAAQKRAVAEGNITRERQYQDERQDRTAAFDQARINGNTEIDRLLKTQANDIDALNRASNTLAGTWDKLVTSIKEGERAIGDAAQAAGKSPAEFQTQATNFAAISTLAASPVSVVTMLLNKLAPSGSGKTGTMSTKDDTVAGKLDRLYDMLNGH